MEGVAVGDDVGVTSVTVAWDAEVMFKPLKPLSDDRNAPLSNAARSLDVTAVGVELLVILKSYNTLTPESSLRPFPATITPFTALSGTLTDMETLFRTANSKFASITSAATMPFRICVKE